MDLHIASARLGEDPLAHRCDPDHVARLRAALAAATVTADGRIATGDRALGVVRPYGSVVFYLPGPPRLRHRALEMDRRGTVTLAVRRGPAAEFLAAWVRAVDGSIVGVLPGRAQHPLWGVSDRIVGDAGLLTVCAAVDWDRIAAIPALADPTRLPAGAGSAILNLLAALAADQDAGPLRYRGPYATEQLFWTLAESFRFDPAVPDPLGRFLEGAEDAFLAGELREAPLDWTPAPHERLLLGGGLYVQLRDGVEKVAWEGRTYYRQEWQGLTRREHRVVRPVSTPEGGRRFVAGLTALGRPLEDHLVLDADGELLEAPAPAGPPAGFEADAPLAAVWREALETLLPLDATPLLGPAITAVWPEFDVAWGPVVRDLVETRAERVRLSPALARLYLAERDARPDAAERRALAHALVREVLSLLGPSMRQAAAVWLDAQPAGRQAELLEAARHVDRQVAAGRAAVALGRLLDALVAGEGLPPAPP